MKRYVVALTVALMLIAPLAISMLEPSQAQEPPTPTQEKPKGEVEAGKKLYEVQCKKCHGDQGQGVERMYKLVKAPLPPVHLGSKPAQEKSDEFIRKSMTEGYKKMEKIPDPLTPQELDNIVAFVRTLKQEPPK